MVKLASLSALCAAPYARPVCRRVGGGELSRSSLPAAPVSLRTPSAPVCRISPTAPRQCPGSEKVCRAVSREDPDLDAFKNALTEAEGLEDKSVETGATDELTGEELVELIRERWGARYDCRIRRQSDRFGKLRFYLQIMWKFLEQKSFPMSEEEYYEQLDAVASLITEWGLAEHVRKEIRESKYNPVIGHTIGGGAKCVSIPLIDADEVAM